MEKITVTAEIFADISKVYEYYTNPIHVINWNFASPDWYAPAAKNELKEGGKFCYTMAARDESFSFDFSGTFIKLIDNQLIEIVLDDDRTMSLNFTAIEKGTLLEETFEPETENSIDLQRGGWQAILDNFKKYCEEN